MKINQQLLRINRNFIICFIASASISAITAQLLADYENYLITSITMAVGYVVFFVIFGSMFYADNKKRFKKMSSSEVKKEIIKLVTSFGIGEIFYLGSRWFSLYYFLEFGIEPYLASLISEIVCTILYMIVVSVFLKATKTY